jgi:ATP-dependent helicase/nuclease subunit A
MPSLTSQQKTAVECIDTNVLVSAGAGSGKTMVLVERYLEVLRSYQDAHVSDIIAVTFTRKAAEEMRNRLKSRLRETIGECPPEERQRWTGFLEDLDRARIGTIHSLCESILRSAPAEAMIDPQFEIMDDLEGAEAIAASVDSALRSLISSNDGDDLLLLEYPVEQLQRWITNQIKSAPEYREARKQICELSLAGLQTHALGVIAAVRLSLLRQLREHAELRRCLRYLESTVFEDPQSPLEAKRRDAVKCLAILLQDSKAKTEDLEKIGVCVGALAGMTVGLIGGAKGKSMREAIMRARDIVKFEFANYWPSALSESDERAFKVLLSLLRTIDAALAYYEQVKLRSQKVDYNDLIHLAYGLLERRQTGSKSAPLGKSGSASVSTATGPTTNLRAILVDEFQDTNRTQARLLSLLCGPDTRLFLIGDDKQSIYKFQGADVSTFNEWKHLIDSPTTGLVGGGLALELSESFRSHPSVVAFINAFFKEHFDLGDRSRYKASYQSLTPSRQDAVDPSRVELVSFLTDKESPRIAEDVRMLEGRALSAWIKEKIAAGAPVFDKAADASRPMSYGDIAVLVGQNSDFTFLELALSEAMIPYVTIAGSGFLNRQEVLDIENMLRWLSDPADDHALLAVLRSPMFAVNDGIIHRLAFGRRSSLWRRLLEAAKSPDLEVLKPVAATLKNLQSVAALQPAGELVRTIIATTSYDTTLSSLANGKQRARNVWKLAARAQAEGAMSAHEFVHSLSSMRQLGVTNQTDAPLSSENAIKLMTIHKSKGLEFPVVLLPVLGRRIIRGYAKVITHRDFGIAFNTSRSRDEEKPSFYRAAESQMSEMDREERKRLLYVAMTRARDYLVMFTEYNGHNNESFRQWIHDALGVNGSDELSSEPALIEQGNLSCLARLVDAQAIAQWIKSSSAVRTEPAPEPETSDFSPLDLALMVPLVDGNEECFVSSVPWQAIERVTPAGDLPVHQTVLGEFFHAIMQRFASRMSKPTQDMLSSLCMSSHFNAVHSDQSEYLSREAQGLVDIFFTSELFEILSKSRRRLHEIPYLAVEVDESIADRRVDLIVEDAEGDWHIIDFKTDQVDVSRLESKTNEHASQILEYVRHFKQLTGHEARGWIYFARLGRLLEVQAPTFEIDRKGQLKLPLVR